MKIDTHACDICNVQKKEVNHWFKGYVFHSGESPCVSIYPWESMKQELHGEIHLCGIEHAMQWAGRELSKLVGKECEEMAEK